MAIFWLAAVTMWTFLVLRSLGGRTALSTGTVVLYSLLGALWGPFTLWAARWFIPNPTWYEVLSLLLLWIPVGAVFLVRDTWRSHTVADAFVLGFAVGFGYDATLELVGTIFRDVARDAIPSLLSFVPPTALQGDFRGVDYAMHGYWLALPTLALVAGLRFLRSRLVAITLAIFCLGLCTIDRIGWMGIVGLGFSEHTANMISIARQNGRLLPLVALGAFVSLSALEAWWVGCTCSTEGKIIQLMRDWQASVMAFADRDWAKFVGVNSLSRVRRQTELLRAEVDHSPRNHRLRIELDASERRLALHPDPNNMPRSHFPSRRIVPGLAALALLTAGLVPLFPFLPESVVNRFWVSVFEVPSDFIWASVPLPPSDSGSMLTSSGVILLVLAAWFYLNSSGDTLENGDVNALIRRHGVFWIKALCLALFSLLFLSGLAPDASFFSNSILNGLNLDSGLCLEQLYTYIPLLMAIALATTLPPTPVVRLPNLRKQRETLYRRVVTLIALLVSIMLIHLFGVDQWLNNSLLNAAGGEWAAESARQWASWLAALGKIAFVLGSTFAIRSLIVLSSRHHLIKDSTALARTFDTLSLWLLTRRKA